MAAGWLLPLALQAAGSEPHPPPPPPPAEVEQPAPPPVDPEILEGRRRPGYVAPLPAAVTQDNPGAVRAPPPQAFPTDQVPVPDRWRLITAFCPQRDFFKTVEATCHSPLDPYHQNALKGDLPLDPAKTPWLPIKGHDWFFTASAVSDTVIEPRTFPIPVGVQTTARPQSLDVFGEDASYALSQTFIVGAALTKGSTAFMPPHIEYRLTLALNLNYAKVPERRVLFVQPSKGTDRFDHFVGVQEAFVDYHLRDVSERYDFDSIRVGIQPFQADFRGFLFNDQQLGVRLFGNRDNNRVQYNLAAFWRLEKDTNSGLNAVLQSPRKDWLLIANLYRQDFLIPALTSQVTVAWNINRESGDVQIDDNGFPVRPALIGSLRGHDYDVVYLGYNADGHIGRINLTASLYGAIGSDRGSVFTGRPSRIRAGFAAAELSYDSDWMRFRLSGALASGDRDPFDDTETGYDAVFENPIFAGADTSYWIRQSIPFAGGGRAIGVSGRNGLLNSLRSSKEQGQSNFNNPGLMLVGAGGDFDVLPSLRVSANANHLWFENTAVLQVLRVEGSIPRDIGWDLSAAAIWRPKATQNVVLRLSAAALVAGSGFRDLFASTDRSNAYYSVLANAVVSY
ncbi:MAG: hypothetical protein ABIP41_07180 [Croceibacterium sp.]